MPSAADFKRAFALRPGERLGQAVTEQCSMGHVVVQPNERYRFPTELRVALDAPGGRPSARRVAADFARDVGGERIVYSAYGSPYQCAVGGVKVKALDADAGTATLEFVGTATRRRDVPTLAQRKEEERRRGTQGGDVDKQGAWHR